VKRLIFNATGRKNYKKLKIVPNLVVTLGNQVFWKTVNIRLNPTFLRKFDFSRSNSIVLTKVDLSRLNSIIFKYLTSAGRSQPDEVEILAIFCEFFAFRLQPKSQKFWKKGLREQLSEYETHTHDTPLGRRAPLLWCAPLDSG